MVSNFVNLPACLQDIVGRHGEVAELVLLSNRPSAVKRMDVNSLTA
ncbi:hypothetical protein [Bacteroides faecium]|uniref:Uncharacterized protein n=1 Tax=Bacteroides faecium TaxID=2715212 RepID=A0A6H0KQ67_9BACE|nr:hypothetical protein [Bacteroides faecium]QIU95606.1 hypothetical protein BacF7301_16260 [Bacteroides faecium]